MPAPPFCTAVAAGRPPGPATRAGMPGRRAGLSVPAVSPILRPDDGVGAGPMAGRRVTGGGRAMRSPLASWFPSGRAREAFRRRALGRQSIVLPPRDRAWRGIAPDFAGSVQMAGTGLPFQIVAEREVDRSGDPRRLAAALAAGQTTYLPQVHQVLPRLTRLMVGLRSAFFGPVAGVAREECSFLFIVEGAGRAGMGLHHDGEVDAFWLQLEGRRTVTIGPRVRPGTPEELDEGLARGNRRAGWRTFDLEPGTLFHLPARTPHAVVCRGRSLAVTLTWARGTRRGGRARGRRPGADGVPRLGCGVGLRRADPAGPLPHALGAGAARRSPPRPRARRCACGHRMARGRGCPPAPRRGSASFPQCRGSRAGSRPGPASSR